MLAFATHGHSSFPIKLCLQLVDLSTNAYMFCVSRRPLQSRGEYCYGALKRFCNYFYARMIFLACFHQR